MNDNSSSNSTDVTDSLLRIKQDLLADLTGRVGVRRTTTISSRSAYSPAFVLVALTAAGLLLMADLAFCRMFYAHHLVQVAVFKLVCCCCNQLSHAVYNFI